MAKEKESARPDSKWLVYVASFPTDDPAARMRVLRTLESLGCAVLREGVYVLPDNQVNRQGLQRLSEHMTRINGSAHILQVTNSDAEQGQTFRSLFDRTGKYQELIKAVEGLRAGFGISDPSAIARVLNKQRREFEAISALDFFTSPLRERTEEVLRGTEAEVRKRMFPDAPKAGGVTQTGRYYFKRVWATRKPLWADRLASAWLIRRFIDPEATLLWLDKSQECPSTAVGFGFEGATFSNSRDKVTFQELLASFSLDNSETLARIGTLVHFLDTGGAPVAEAAGVDTLLQGARRRSNSDEELFAESEKTFDLLYEAYFESPGKGADPR
ncbi:MAG: chromate resistance protein [Betaproteobacteria bacterium]|nr:MAG: chromate resistance protein [Betaproteobacteria bacterium]TMG78851.1 MAG: chromate resistance protein [Betaproteobacteria bacterium]